MSSLKDRLADQIREHGPMTVAQYMTACLYDPQAGYYATRPALGAEGDFVTAPLVSQMFGELIGLWAVETWRAMGAPKRFLLVEAGPGDGTLISDILRAARLMPPFIDAAELWLVEVSEPLKARQKAALGGVAESAIAAMVELGARPERMVAAIGPCIGPASYEVGLEYEARFVDADAANGRFFAPGRTAEKRMFDLPGFVLARIAAAGVGRSEWVGVDTCANEDFFSNRRAVLRGEPDYGRLLSAIMIESDELNRG